MLKLLADVRRSAVVTARHLFVFVADHSGLHSATDSPPAQAYEDGSKSETIAAEVPSAEVPMLEKNKALTASDETINSDARAAQTGRSRRIQITDRVLAIKDTSPVLRKVDADLVAKKLGAHLSGDAPKR
jgi:hypothetical protein